MSRSTFLLALVCVALCGVQTLAAEFAYDPGQCRQDNHQYNVDACLSNVEGAFCEWCDVSSHDITPKIAEKMGAARKSEYGEQLQATWMKLKSQVSRRAPRRTPEELAALAANYQKMADEVEEEDLDPRHPRRCARKWTKETCPGKIYYKRTFCESQIVDLIKAKEKLQALRELHAKGEGPIAPENRQLQEGNAREDVQRAYDRVQRYCEDQIPAKENDVSNRHSDEEFDALYLSPDHEALTTPSSADEKRLRELLPRYVKTIMPSNPRSESVGPTLEPDVCHQWSTSPPPPSSHVAPLTIGDAEQSCYLAGCAWCPFNQRAATHVEYKPCQPAWDSNSCRVSDSDRNMRRSLVDLSLVEDRSSRVRSSHSSHRTDNRKRYILSSLKAFATFPRPGSTAGEMEVWKREAAAFQKAASDEMTRQGPRISVTHDRCKLLSTLLSCVDYAAECKWCVNPVEAGVPRCSKRWGSFGEVCYEAPISKEEEKTLLNGIVDAYTTAVEINENLAAEHAQKVATEIAKMVNSRAVPARRTEPSQGVGGRRRLVPRREVVVTDEEEAEVDEPEVVPSRRRQVESESEGVRLPSLGKQTQGSRVSSLSAPLRATPQSSGETPSLVRRSAPSVHHGGPSQHAAPKPPSYALPKGAPRSSRPLTRGSGSGSDD